MPSVDRLPKSSRKYLLSTCVQQIGRPLVLILAVTVATASHTASAAKPSPRKSDRTASRDADDPTFSPTARLSGSVGKGGKNEKPDVQLVQRLLANFGYDLKPNGKADPALFAAITKFQSIYLPTAKADGVINPGGQTWNTLIGIGRIKGSLDDLAKQYDLEPAVILAIQSVESGNNGYLPDGRPKILFEGHVFWRQLKNAGKNPADYVKGNEDILFEKQDRSKYISGKAEYVRLEKAQKIDRVAALKSASWGEF